MTIEEWRTWLYNKDNKFNCEECPENLGMDNWQGRYPCGQWHCWVELHTKEGTENGF